MEDHHPEREGARLPDLSHAASQAALDRQLEAALANYASVEPRPGLESRILASLQAERNLRAVASQIPWARIAAFAITAIAVATVITILWRSQETRHIAMHRTAPTVARTVRPTATSISKNASDHAPPVGVLRHLQRSQPHIPRESEAVVVVLPKLDVFPSPQPLSEQEQVLADYVADYPDHAALIAQARTEELHRDIEEHLRTNTGNDLDSQH